jgi:hypothetical protein
MPRAYREEDLVQARVSTVATVARGCGDVPPVQHHSDGIHTERSRSNERLHHGFRVLRSNGILKESLFPTTKRGESVKRRAQGRVESLSIGENRPLSFLVCQGTPHVFRWVSVDFGTGSKERSILPRDGHWCEDLLCAFEPPSGNRIRNTISHQNPTCEHAVAPYLSRVVDRD